MVHKKEKLTAKEKKAQNIFLAGLKIAKRKTKKPVIVAMIGLVGSGKSSVAKELANLIGANIINGDEIRILLRKEGERYEGMRKIAENAAIEIIQQGGNVIMDADHIDSKKRASLRARAQKLKIRIIFIRVYSEDFDIMIGRNMTAIPDEFFGGAKTSWKGSGQEKGSVVKLREMMRRIPHHYRWENKGGGRWILKKLPFNIFSEINTAYDWKKEVQKIAEKIF